MGFLMKRIILIMIYLIPYKTNPNMKVVDRIGKCKNIKEAVNFLMNEYNYSRIELSQVYDDNEILRMIDDDNRAEMAQPLVFNIKDLTISAESAGKIEFVIEAIRFTINKSKDHFKFYHMISGEIYYIGRKVMYAGKRYSVVFHDKDLDVIYLTDNTKLIATNEYSIKIINENILYDEIGDLFVNVYSNIQDKINFVSYLEVFSHIYDIELASFIVKLNVEMKENLKNSLRSYLTRNNLELF